MTRRCISVVAGMVLVASFTVTVWAQVVVALPLVAVQVTIVVPKG